MPPAAAAVPLAAGTAAAAGSAAAVGSAAAATAAAQAAVKAALFASTAAGGFSAGGAALTFGQALALGTFGLSALGQLSSAFAQRQAAAFNAATLRQQAERARQIAERDADAFARRQNRVRAAARARRAGSGITSEGTPLLVDDAALDEALLGEATIRVGGQTRATRLEQQAVLSRFRGQAARTEGLFDAGSTLLTGFREAKFG